MSMGRWIAALVVGVGLLCAPSVALAAADTCTFTADGNWTAIGTHPATTGCDNGGVIENVDRVDIGGQDITIPAGSTITFATGTATAGCCDFTGGGTLTLGRADDDTSAVLINGDGGMAVESGGTLNMPGSCKLFNGNTGGADFNAATCDEDDPMFIGDIIPCMGAGPGTEDCATTPNQLGIVWTEAKYGEANWTLTRIDEVILDLTDDHDLLCFPNFWPTSEHQSGEVGNCYEVVDHNETAPAGGSEDMWVTIDLQQHKAGSSEETPVSRQDLIETTLASAVVNGQREIELAAATFGPESGGANPLADQDQDYDGIYIRFDLSGNTPCTPGTDCEPADTAWITQHWEDDYTGGAPGPDMVRLLHSKGITLPAGTTSIASGTLVWLGLHQGIKTGDRFVFIDPARIEAAAAVGSLDHLIAPFHVDDGGTWNFEYAYVARAGDVDLDQCPGDPGWVWFRDIQSEAPADPDDSWLIDLDADEQVCHWWDFFLMTAVNEDVVGTDVGMSHALVAHPQTDGSSWSFGVRKGGTTIRYRGDDWFWADTFDDHTTADTFTATFPGLSRSEWETDDPDTSQALFQCSDAGAEADPDAITAVFDAVLIKGASGGPVVGSPPPIADTIIGCDDEFDSVIVNEAVIIGGRSAINTDDGNHLEFNNTLVADIDVFEAVDVGTALGGSFGALVPPGKNVVVRESTNTGTGARDHVLDTSGLFESVWMKDLSQAKDTLDILGSGLDPLLVVNAAIEDVRIEGGSHTQNFFLVLNANGGTRLERIGFYRDRVATLGVGAYLQHSGDNADPTPKIGGWYVDGYAHTLDALRGNAGGWNNTEFTGPFCAGPMTGDHMQAIARITIGNAGISIYDGIEPGMRSRSERKFWTVKGALADQLECGPKTGSQAPGIHKQTLPLSIVGLEPECFGDVCGAGGTVRNILPQILPTAGP